MIASLAWYPAARPAWDRLWHATRAHLGYGPATLTWPAAFHDHWRRPDLLLSMTCALPMQLGLARHVAVVGAPVWDLPALPAGHYASHIVTRAEDRRPIATAAAQGLAVNAGDSQSGWGTLVAAGLDRLGPRVVTGSHAASIEAVAEGRAGLAAIDVVTWAIAPDERLRVRVTTPPTPATPFITALPRHLPDLRSALTRAIAAQSSEDRALTRLGGLIQMEDAAYSVPLRRTG